MLYSKILIEELWSMEIEDQDDGLFLSSIEYSLSTGDKLEEAIKSCELARLRGEDGDRIEWWLERAKNYFIYILQNKYKPSYKEEDKVKKELIDLWLDAAVVSESEEDDRMTILSALEDLNGEDVDRAIDVMVETKETSEHVDLMEETLEFFRLVV